MNKTDLIKMTQEKVRATLPEADKKVIIATIETLFDADSGTILDCLRAEDRKLSMPRFGIFEVVTRKAREATNPATGEKIQLGERHQIKFRASGALKEKVS